MRSVVPCALVALALAVTSADAGSKYTDPDAPDVMAAAKAALVNARVLDIVGITRGIDALLEDLGAKVTDREVRIEMPSDILFDFDSASLRPEAPATLRKIADVLESYARAPVTVEGHTDSKGADAYNLKLSEQRAASVTRWLVAEGGVAKTRLTSRGLGETRPLVSNTKPDGSDDPDGRQRNRRVEIVVKKG